MATATAAQEQVKTLEVPNTEAIRQELGLIDPAQAAIEAQPDAELEKTADQFIASVMA